MRASRPSARDSVTTLAGVTETKFLGNISGGPSYNSPGLGFNGKRICEYGI
jgi:hypothetical protein